MQGCRCKNKLEGFGKKLSNFSTPNRAVLEPILADLDRIWELRHWIPNPGEPISPKKFHLTL